MSSRLRPSLLKATSAGFALILFGLGVPQTGDAIMRFYADSSIDINKLEDSRSRDLASAEAMLKAADRRFGDPEALIRAGIVERRLGYGPNGEADHDKLELARADLEDGLARAPANDLAWAELALARLGLNDSNAAKAAWRTSILFGNFDPSLNLFRTEIGLQLWLTFDAQDRRMLNDQIAFAWDDELSRRQLITLAKQSNFIRNVIRDAFAQDPDRLSAFDQAVQSGS